MAESVDRRQYEDQAVQEAIQFLQQLPSDVIRADRKRVAAAQRR
jgi:hypothetical protein